MSLAFTYPGGTLKTITIAATAGNVITNKSPGAGKRWVVLYGNVVLVTDATVADRRINSIITDGTNTLVLLPTTNVIAASLTRTVDFFHGLVLSGAVLQGNFAWSAEGMILEGADQFRISITSGVAGDSYSGRMRVLEIGITP